jgi:large subunit ribosomal protein L35
MVGRPCQIAGSSLPRRDSSAISATFTARLKSGLPWRCSMRVIYFRNNHRIFNALTSISAANALPLGGFLCGYKESQMPKLKTKSGAKKRFKVTATGKVMHAQKGKRHGMIKRTKKQIRQLRGTRVLFKTDGDNVKKYFLPNA